MPRISFTPHLQMHLNCPPMEVAGDSVQAVLTAVFQERPALRGYLLDDQGAVRKHVAIFVNQRPLQDRQRQQDRLQTGDEVFVFQALSGG